MAITCPQCSHTNPAGAKYCFYDGHSLSAAAHSGPVDPGSQAFAHPFVFPTGGKCENFDQLAVACQKDWNTACELLRVGTLESFLGGLGRADLAMAAREAVQSANLDRGLDQFISRLPTQAVPRPLLKVEPLSVRLEPTNVGTDGSFVVKVRNLGARLLYGSVSANAAWLQPGEAADNGPKLFQIGSEGQVNVSVRGQHLRAGANALEGKLIFETNGGRAEIPVKVNVLVAAYTEGVLAGAITPRQLAEKALKHAKESVPLFENGSVAEWYKMNGWAYPVPGPVASGLGAVQQFFEALGLTKPPRLQVRDQDVQLAGAPGAVLRHVLQVSTADNKPIFVHASSNESWLSAGQAQVKGAIASIPLEVQAVPDRPGELLSARVIVTGNGNQRFDIPVSLQVDGVAAAVAGGTTGKRNSKVDTDPGRRKTQADFDTAISPQKTKPSAGTSRSAPANPFEDLDSGSTTTSRRKTRLRQADDDPKEDGIVVRPASSRKNASIPRPSLLHLIPLGLLFLAVVGIFLADVWGKVPHSGEAHDDKKTAKGPGYKVDIGAEEIVPVTFAPRIEDDPDDKGAGQVRVEIKDDPSEFAGGDGVPIDPEPLVRFHLNEKPNTLNGFGVATTKAAGSKRLTYALPNEVPDGSTNSTVVSIDGETQQFGNSVTGRRYFDDSKGKDQPRNPLLSDELWGVRPHPKDKKAGLVMFQEIVEVVPGRQPAVVKGSPRRQLDTVLVRYIMHNKDKEPHRVGMRFVVDTLIGDNDGVPFTAPGLPGLVDTCHDFRDAKQVPDFIQVLEKPDLIKPGTVAHMTLKLGGSVAPPDRVSITAWPGPSLQWEVPVEPIKSRKKDNFEGDSAVVLYWYEKELKPGAKREIGFAYGLGTVTSTDKVGSLAITVGGSFQPGQSFTITAYVRHPEPNQTLTLELPDGLERLSGAGVVSVPAVKADQIGIVTWKAKVLRTGEFPIRVKSSTGIAQTKTVSITQTEPAGGKFLLTLENLEPPFEPGKVFQISAHVADPQPKQTLTLNLPPGLEEVDGRGARNVPKDGVVRWQVKLLEPGRLPIKVASSTGVTQSKTITLLKQAAPSGDHFEVKLQGDDFAPGKSFKVVAKVPRPVAGQTLTLELPRGLDSAKNQLEKPVPADANSSVSWPVKILEPGKYPVKVISNTGIAVRKILTIDPPPSREGGDFKMTFEGGIGIGKDFQIVAKVAHPAKNQTLTLVLPDGIKLLNGVTAVSVPASDKNGPSTVTWHVRLDKAGAQPVKIQSSTGQVKTRTISTTIFD